MLWFMGIPAFFCFSYLAVWFGVRFFFLLQQGKFLPPLGTASSTLAEAAFLPPFSKAHVVSRSWFFPRFSLDIINLSPSSVLPGGQESSVTIQPCPR